MKNLSVAKKLALMTSSIWLFIIIVSALMTALVLQQDKQAQTYREVDVAAIKYMKDVQIYALELRRYEKDILLNIKDSNAVEANAKKWSEQIVFLRESSDKAKELPIGVTATQNIEKMQALLMRYENGIKSVTSNLTSGTLNDLSLAYAEFSKYEKLIHDVMRNAAEVAKSINSHAEGLVISNQQSLTLTRYIIAISTLLGLVLISLSGWWIARQFTLPLKEATRIAHLVSQGDLTQSIPVKSKDEVGQLCTAFNQMIDSLKKLVSEVRNSVEHVSSASSQIVQGNLDLSSRTEQQASSLEQTAASMEQFTSSMQSNTDATKEAVSYVKNASMVAQRGGEVVGQVVNTMGEIEASSKKINDIIGVIDGIAFQTNILALNAAVEAARAGEQGRGFAVVASEVRNLAQRSASAAKEIKTLIQESVGKVGEGSRLVGDAGQTMADIVTGVQSITDIMNRISNSTLEQTSGISQVNQAVGQLDQMTQQNAALVEQASAAAASLQQQAARLSSAVSFFNLGNALLASESVPPVPVDQPTATIEKKMSLHKSPSAQTTQSPMRVSGFIKSPLATVKSVDNKNNADSSVGAMSVSVPGKLLSRRDTDSANGSGLSAPAVVSKIPIPKESDDWDEF